VQARAPASHPAERVLQQVLAASGALPRAGVLATHCRAAHRQRHSRRVRRRHQARGRAGAPAHVDVGAQAPYSAAIGACAGAS